VARVLSTAFCVALLAATAGAFALTEKAKLQLSPIYATQFVPPDRIFSPNCNCQTSAAYIEFRLRKSNTLSVWMERNGKRVRTLVSGHHYRKGEVSIEFNGVADNGLTLPDGRYAPVIHFASSHLTLHLPDQIVIDTKPPRLRIQRRIYTHVSPGCNCKFGTFRIPFHLSKPGHGILLLNGKQQLWLTRGLRESGTLVWNGKVDGVAVKQGNYVLYASAEDAAGNRTKPEPIAVVTVRYIELGRKSVTAAPGKRFAISVLTDARSYSWLFDRGRGTARGRTLKLRAPRQPGTYALYVSEDGHSAKATVVVG
jgi:hypothetical protein